RPRRAVSEDLLRRNGPDAVAHLDAGGDLRPGGHRRTGEADALIKEVLKVRPALLEAGRVHVGQVVGDGVDVELLAAHARRSRVKRAHHDGTSPFCLIPRKDWVFSGKTPPGGSAGDSPGWTASVGRRPCGLHLWSSRPALLPPPHSLSPAAGGVPLRQRGGVVDQPPQRLVL